jgi:uncharacterized protein (DUF1501 family)
MRPEFLTDRRGLLKLGAAGVCCWGLPRSLSAARDAQFDGFGRAKSVLLVMLSGGPSQLDTIDPKPDAPAEVRGEFNTISTALPGVAVCEHLPKLAQQLNRWALVRTLAHQEHNHLLATHIALTGRPTPLPRGGSDLDRVESRSDFPNMAAALDHVRPRNDGIPTGVSLPNYLIEGPLTWPGQHAGFLGAKHDPWQIQGDPSQADFKMHALTMRDGVGLDRFHSRRDLLGSFTAPSSGNSASVPATSVNAFRQQQQSAYNILTSGKVVGAFDIHSEADEVRDRYGRNKFGQSLLMSRRLIDAGVPVVQATMGIVQTWDTHTDNWGRLKNTLLPQLDQGLAALMDDLHSSGKIEETLVMVMGEFGRTPKISTLPGEKIPGRDHWAHAYSGLFAGAGVRGGQVIGKTDSQAAYPLTRSWSPADCCSTVFHALGINDDITVTDPLQRNHLLVNGTVIKPLYSGADA